MNSSSWCSRLSFSKGQTSRGPIARLPLHCSAAPSSLLPPLSSTRGERLQAGLATQPPERAPTRRIDHGFRSVFLSLFSFTSSSSSTLCARKREGPAGGRPAEVPDTAGRFSPNHSKLGFISSFSKCCVFRCNSGILHNIAWISGQGVTIIVK